MCRRLKRQWAGYIKMAVVVAVTSFLLSMEGLAAEDSVMPSAVASESAMDSSVMLDDNTFSVELPVVPEGEPSPFDFILDPCGLVYETNAMRYGGGTVEEGATMLFHNREGEYDFSKYSDNLSITNQTGRPVIVTVSAVVSDLDGIELVGQNDFSDNENSAIYLAITDDRGNEQPISGDGEALIQTELDTGVYSFGLTGACNLNADWQDIYSHPSVTVTWYVEPALAETEEELKKEIDSPKEGEENGKAPDQENLQKTPVDDAASQDGRSEVSEPADEPETSNPPTKEGGATDQDIFGDDLENPVPSKEPTDYVSGTDVFGDFSGDTLPLEEKGDSAFVPSTSREHPENSPKDSETEAEGDTIEKGVSDSAGVDIKEKDVSDSADAANREKRVSDSTGM